MSDAVFAHLPRFDVVAERRPADWLRALASGEAMPAPVMQGLEEDSLPAPPPVKSEPVAVHPIPQETAALQATIGNLSKLMDRLDREARQHSVQTVQAIAAQLFPELSRRFLAEEIGRHLPALIPSAGPVVEITAEPELAEQLREMVARNAGLEGRCEVIGREGQGPGRADVSWRTGGVTFDFDGLLQACLADLGTPHKPNTEQM